MFSVASADQQCQCWPSHAGQTPLRLQRHTVQCLDPAQVEVPRRCSPRRVGLLPGRSQPAMGASRKRLPLRNFPPSSPSSLSAASVVDVESHHQQAGPRRPGPLQTTAGKALRLVVTGREPLSRTPRTTPAARLRDVVCRGGRDRSRRGRGLL